MAKLINKIQTRIIKKLGIEKEPHIIKNFSYSLALHLAAILIIYLSFNLSHKVKNDKKERVIINFVMNSKDVPMKPQLVPPQSKEKEIQKEPEKLKEEKPEPQKEEKNPDPKKEEKKPEKKLEPKKPEPKKKEEVKSKAKEKKPEKKPEKKIEKKLEKKPEKKLDKKPEVKKEESKKEEKKIEEPKKTIPKDIPKESLKEVSKSESGPSFTEKTIDKLDLPVRDKFNIQSQIVGCYKRAIAQFGGNKSNETIMVNIKLAKDGTIDQKNMLFKDYDRYSNSNEKEFRRAVDIVKQTISFCSPLRKMPEDKYNVWKEIDLQFSDSVISN